MNSSSLGLMSYCTLAIEFLELKYYTNYLFYQLFLSPPDFFPLILSVAVASFFSHKPNEIKKKKGKKKEIREKRKTCS